MKWGSRLLAMSVLTALLVQPSIAGPVALAASSTASGPSVRITDDALQPAEVCTVRTRKVTWVNAGTRVHRVAPDQRSAWTAFSLAPGRSKSIQFSRAGRFPYKVDGSIPGVVRVAAACGAGTSGSGGSGAAGGTAGATGNRSYRYDVEVRGFLKNKGQVVDSDGQKSQDWERTRTWTGTWTNVRIDVIEVSGLASAIQRGSLEFGFAAGSVRAVLEYRFLYRGDRGRAPVATCSGSITMVRTYGFALGLTVSGFSTSAQIRDGGNTLYAAESEEWRTRCDDTSPPPLKEENFRTPAGFETDLFSDLLTVSFKRDGEPLRAAPIDLLLRGAAFSLESGVHTSTEPSCTGACSGEVTAEQHYEFIFMPTRSSA